MGSARRAPRWLSMGAGRKGGGGRRPAAVVAHVITLLEWGGAQENTLRTVAGLDTERFERVLVAGSGGMLDDKAAAIPRCRFVRIPALVRRISPFHDARALFALRAFFSAEKHRAGDVPLVVHTHSSKAGILGRAAARAAGADVVVHSIHGFGFHDGQPAVVRRLFIGLERTVSRWTDAFIAVSRENVRTGVREKIFTEDRCRLIRSGFDPAPFIAASRARGRRAIGAAEGVPVAGTVAVFKPQKAPLDFVAAAARVARALPEAIFVMVGGGVLRPAAEEAAARAGLAGRFRFLGWREDVADLMKGFDVFVLTSRWEGLPKVIPQALLCGTPVVATAVDGTREIVTEGADGFLVPPGDVEALARRILEILSGRARLSPGAKREAILSEFDAEAMVRAQERLYLELLARKGLA